MPSGYQSTATRPSISSERQSPSESPSSWSRRNSSTAARRLSSGPSRNSPSMSGDGRSPYSRPCSSRDIARRTWGNVLALGDQTLRAFWRLSPLQRMVALVGVAASFVLVVLGIVYSARFFDWVAGASESWRALPGGWIIMFFAVFVTGIPPMIGYSTACTLCGIVYGFPLGWPIAAAGCVFGSLFAFFASRTVLSSSVDRMVGKDRRFVALGQVMRRDGILYLAAVRFCPLPFSLSNGFLATIPTITPLSFAIATALSTPKLLIHAFIGSRLAILAEKGDEMTGTDKLINYLGIAIGSTIGIVVGIVIYRRTMARAAELARESGGQQSEAEEGDAGYFYDDADTTVADAEDVADLLPEDDISLWETQTGGSYADDDDDNDDQDGKKSRGKIGAVAGID